MSKAIVERYESAFSKWLHCGTAFSFWKGRVGLYAVLKAMGIGPGDDVVLPGYTCVVDVNPIKYLGASPVYVDIEPVTFNMDIELMQEKITPNTRLIIAQHTYGYPCDMDAMMNTADHHTIPVIEDSCMGFGSEYKGRKVGTFGKAAYFSSQWNKTYTTGIGGMVSVNDSDLIVKIESLCKNELCQPSMKEIAMLLAQLGFYRVFIYPRTTALAQSLFRALVQRNVVVGSSKFDEYKAAPAEPDFFKAMSAIQAKSGLRQLKKVEQNIAHRKKLAWFYDRLLAEKGWPARQYDESVMDPVMVRYPVRIAEKEKALSEAAKAGIELGDWFNSVLHQIETSLEAYDYEVGTCPQAEKAAREVVNLPLHPRTNEKTAIRTVEFITQFTRTS
jgi:dTDP-4-amino-4,6-dideoxygalactose transaminase